MDPKTELLEKLRIDRTQTPAHRGAGRRRWPIVVLAAVLAAAGAVWVLRPAGHGTPVHAVIAKAAAPGVARPGVATPGAPAAAGSLLDASGYVVALREATVSAKSIYKVSEVTVQEGQRVKRGELLATLDDSNARAALEQSRAQVRQLEAALAAASLAADDARPSFLRNSTQLTEGLISRETFDASKASYDAAQTAVLVAERTLSVAKANVQINQRYEDDTVIKAPFDGVVTLKSAQPGEIVSPQFLGGGGIAKIVDMDSLEVDVDVSENFINRVYATQAAVITLNAYPNWQIPADVIAVIPTADRAKATVKVRIGFKEKDPRIVPEMGARVSFLGTSPGIAGVVLPAEAVQISGDAGIVYVIRGDAVERRAVRLGAHTADGLTVLAGLQPGAVVALGDFSKLADKSRVRIIQ
jgi:RND family efflux transporter MFP subunit